MKTRVKRKLPVNFYYFFAVIIVSVSMFVSSVSFLPDKMVYYSTALAMPEGIIYRLSQLKNDFIRFFLTQYDADFIQNDGSINDLIRHRDFSDLTVVPEDIVKNTEYMQNLFDDGKYVFDGAIVEKTFTDYQATDSFENIHVRNVTADSEIDIESIVKTGCTLPVEDYSEPVVLIYHTHTTESYIMTDNGEFSTDYPTRNDDKNINMVRIGDEITAVLESEGIGVIHDRDIYDASYNGAYDKSRQGIEEILEKYPSVVITLDIHRDAIYYDDYTRVKPVTEINSEKAAQLMIIAGSEGGNVSSFPDWEKNLAFAVNLQKYANNKYENLMKPIYFCNRKYNMDLTPYSLLIEVGTDVNTLREAAYSGRLLGDVLADYIKQNKKEDIK
ncbi:MAG: stage II sporulation protein P [Clostridia bacterium]|nr:stage II sporulation protein P [Clostridia bacterium]